MEDIIVEEAKKRMGRPPKSAVETTSDVAALQAMVSSLADQVKQLQNPGVIRQEKRADEHFANLKLWDECLVVGVGQVKTNYKEANPQLRLVIDLVIRDKSGELSKIQAPYSVFMEEGKPILCKVLQDKRESRTVVAEYANKLSVGKSTVTGDITSTDIPTSERIAMEVTRIERSITMEVLEGEQTGTNIEFTETGMCNINAINA